MSTTETTQDPIKITAWAMGVDNSNPFRAPEARAKYFTGLREDGQHIQTAPVEKKLAARLFRCGIETIEIVGEPAPEYAAFCDGIGKPLDPADPIKLIGRAVSP